MDGLSTDFIEDAVNDKKGMTVFLTNGVKLTGTITEQDVASLTLKRDGVNQLIFKHAIATVMPPIYS